MQAMDLKALAQGREPLLKVALIQLAEQGSILSVTLAHCVSGMQRLNGAHAACQLLSADDYNCSSQSTLA